MNLNDKSLMYSSRQTHCTGKIYTHQHLLSWSVSNGSVVDDSYEVVWEKEDRDQQNSVVTGLESNNYTIVELESGVDYVITVTASNRAGKSSSSVKVATGMCMCMCVCGIIVKYCQSTPIIILV